MDGYLQSAIEAARLGGEILMRFRGKAVSKEKSPRDLVTDADLASQKAIEELICTRYPEHAFLGEESTTQERDQAVASKRRIWAVDPLDGTANYVHGLQNFAVSIALVQGSTVLLGVVFDPTVNSLFAATRDGPATLNGSEISRSSCEKLDQAMVACSFPARVKKTDLEVTQFLHVLENCQSIRRLGSAALNLCYVAQGCLDGYWARSVQTWDVAAGTLIATQAGAFVSGVNGEIFDLWSPHLLATCSRQLHSEMLSCMHQRKIV